MTERLLKIDAVAEGVEFPYASLPAQRHDIFYTQTADHKAPIAVILEPRISCHFEDLQDMVGQVVRVPELRHTNMRDSAHRPVYRMGGRYRMKTLPQ